MKKSIVLSLVLSSLMYGYVNPLPNSSKSIENGGTLSAIDAYQDGVGAMVIQDGRGIDNSVMNNLVFKYGNEAKENNVNLGDQVLLSGTAEDKLLAGKLFADGANCNDGNSATSGETYLNGICQGGLAPVNGTSCDDNNALTYGDSYTNGLCSGVTNGTGCDDNNANTYGDVYTNGVCSGSDINSCKALKLLNPSLGSAIYTINTTTGQTVYCDMTTDGGGWTLVFLPESESINSSTQGYTTRYSSGSMLPYVAGSTETMIAFMNPATKILSNPHSFLTPIKWKTLAPMSTGYGNDTIITFKNLITNISNTGYLNGSNRSFSSRCGDSESSDPWGRICISNSTAPFYAGFNYSGVNTCTTSDSVFAAEYCSSTKLFAIFIR